jgi:hypothetical protein
LPVGDEPLPYNASMNAWPLGAFPGERADRKQPPVAAKRYKYT